MCPIYQDAWGLAVLSLPDGTSYEPLECSIYYFSDDMITNAALGRQAMFGLKSFCEQRFPENGGVVPLYNRVPLVVESIDSGIACIWMATRIIHRQDWDGVTGDRNWCNETRVEFAKGGLSSASYLSNQSFLTHFPSLPG